MLQMLNNAPAPTVDCTVARAFTLGGEVQAVGQRVPLPQPLANELLAAGRVVRYVAPAEPDANAEAADRIAADAAFDSHVQRETAAAEAPAAKPTRKAKA